MERNRLDGLEARRRVAAQPPIEAKLARADRVIDNSGSIDATRAQVLKAWNALPGSMQTSVADADDERV